MKAVEAERREALPEGRTRRKQSHPLCAEACSCAISTVAEQSARVSLAALGSLRIYSDVQQVAIWGNPSLTELDLNSFTRAGGLLIRDNAVLGSLGPLVLDRVGDLETVNNPALSVAPFAAVQAFTRKVSGNQDDESL